MICCQARPKGVVGPKQEDLMCSGIEEKIHLDVLQIWPAAKHPKALHDGCVPSLKM